MGIWRRSSMVVVLCSMALLPTIFGSSPGSASVGPDGCSPQWTIVPSPNLGQGDNFLRDVAAISAGDLWAVGDAATPAYEQHTLTLHWDGIEWDVVASPSNEGPINTLSGVDGIATDDVWAVGHSDVRTLALNWDGTSWEIVPTPSSGSDAVLTGVAAISSQDAWSVGYSIERGVSRTLVVHWDGATWSIVRSPNVGSADNYLYGVEAVGASDVWAAGTYARALDYTARTLIMHWDGVRWSVVPSPNVGDNDNTLWGIDAASATDLWAVGLQGFEDQFDTLTLHGDGTTWTPIKSPNPSGIWNSLTDVKGVGPNEAWSVGWAGPYTSDESIVGHWDGAKWTSIRSPDPPSTNSLAAVDAPSGGEVWAVGTYHDGSRYVTLTERVCR